MKIKKNGFSIIDLLVSMSIVTLIMSVVLFSYRTFSNKLAVSAASQEIAIAVRQAQTYAVSVKETAAGSGNFTTGYGVSFDINDPHAYYIFADKNSNGIYDGDSTCSAASECVEKGNIRNNVSVSQICGLDAGGVRTCPPTGATAVDIVFPPSDFQSSNIDATTKFKSGNTALAGTYQAVTIVTSLADAFTQTTIQNGVTINQTGQVYVQSLASIPTSNNPPVITLVGSNPIIVSTGSTYTDAGATANDTEDGNITTSIVKTGTVNTLIPGTYTLTYNVTDSAEFAATPVTRTVTVTSSCNPTFAGSVVSGNNAYSFPYDLALVGNYAYVVNTNSNSFQIFNISNPTNPTSVATIPTYIAPHAIVVNGTYAYVVSDGFFKSTLQVYNISNPASPITVVVVDINAESQSSSNMVMDGNYLYIVSSKDNTLKIYDVSNPASPTLHSTIAAGTLPARVRVVGNYAYVISSGSQTLKVYDISNPINPVNVGTVAGGNFPSHFDISGNYVYMTNTLDNTLQVFNVTNPASPISVATVAAGTQPEGVSVQGNYVYITNYLNNTMRVFDISIPANPTQVGIAVTDNNPLEIIAKNNYAYVINASSNTLQVFNLTCF